MTNGQRFYQLSKFFHRRQHNETAARYEQQMMRSDISDADRDWLASAAAKHRAIGATFPEFHPGEW